MLAGIKPRRQADPAADPAAALHQPCRLFVGQAAFLSGARYRGMREVMAGWAAGALLPVAQLVQPLRLLTWQDTLPSGRDLEEALGSALQVRRKQLWGMH